MKTVVCVVFAAVIASSHAQARDGFEKVRCGEDVVRALIGQRGNDEPVAATEARHKDVGLKDLGASDYGAFSSIAWLICGHDYMELVDNHTDVVRDAILVPPHSKDRPWFEGFCRREGGKLSKASFVGILRDRGGTDELRADVAWAVDEKAVKFVRVPTDDLLCQRAGILEPR